MLIHLSISVYCALTMCQALNLPIPDIGDTKVNEQEGHGPSPHITDSPSTDKEPGVFYRNFILGRQDLVVYGF